MQTLVEGEADTGAAARHPMAVRWRRSGRGRDAYGERLAGVFRRFGLRGRRASPPGVSGGVLCSNRVRIAWSEATGL